MKNFPSFTLPSLHIKSFWLSCLFQITSSKYSTFILSLEHCIPLPYYLISLPNLPIIPKHSQAPLQLLWHTLAHLFFSPANTQTPCSSLSPRAPFLFHLSTQCCLFDCSLFCAGYTTLSSVMLQGGSLSNITNSCRVLALSSSPRGKMCAQHSVCFWDSLTHWCYICTDVHIFL